MTFETVTSLAGPEVLKRAKAFFGRRIPNAAAFPERAEGAKIPVKPAKAG